MNLLNEELREEVSEMGHSNAQIKHTENLGRLVDHNHGMGKETILIVDDDAIERELLSRRLNSFPYNLIFAKNGEEALIKAADENPDLILLDVRMPGIDGYEVCSHLRSDTKMTEIPIIMFTGLNNEQAMLKGIEVGADDFISKNSEPLVLHTRIKAILRLNRYRRLNSERAKFQRLIELAPDGILIASEDGRIQLTNPAIMNILKAEGLDSVVGQNVAAFITPESLDPFLKNVESIFADPSKVLRFESAVVGLDNQSIPVEIDIGHFIWEEEDAIQIIVRDITAHKWVLEVLEQSKNKELVMKNQFLSQVSHELRTPITVILQFVSILADGLAGDINQEQSEYLEIVNKNAHQLRYMIDDLLDVTRSQFGKLSIVRSDVSLDKLITETISSFEKTANAKKISLSANVSDKSSNVYADYHRVRQIMINLIENAIKFTPDGGSITVRSEVFEKDPDYACLSVTDTGCGISSVEKEKIFEELYQCPLTVKNACKGLGLGLYICKELVTLHGGQIWIESQENKGSTFYFTLPVSNPNVE